MAGLFIWTNLNPLNPRTLWAKFGWNWSSGSGEELWKYEKFTTTTTKTTTFLITGHGDLSKWVKNSEWDEELQTSKQTNQIKSPWFWFCMLSLVQVGSGKDFQMLTMHFHCCYYIPLLKDMVLQMNNNISIYFLFIFFSILCKSEGVTLHWTNLNSLHPRMHWAKFGWNWLSDYWGEYF